jgi:hypothetical protein
MSQYRPLQVRDCQGTLWAFYREYLGEALASFEGDLAALELNSIPGASIQETSYLKRQTIEPELDFYVVPINETSVEMLKARLSKRGVLGKDGVVIHTQIEVANELILVACDNFHDECTVAARSIPIAFLSQLKSHGLLRGYSDA